MSLRCVFMRFVLICTYDEEEDEEGKEEKEGEDDK